MEVNLLTGERLDYVNDKLSLIQRSDGLTFGTDALLLAGYISAGGKIGLELGSGTGIISLLLLTRDKLAGITAVEVQSTYAALSERNAALNGLADRLCVLNQDIRELPSGEEYDVVFTNPPYMKTDSGLRNAKDEKNAARHEVFGGIVDFVRCARKKLKYGGSFYAVYRTDRLTDLIFAMKSEKIEPKRITPVYADTESEPSMVLVEGRYGGGTGLYMTKPLILYKDASHKEYTSDMEYILENGSFPHIYYNRGTRNGRK